MKTLTYGLLIFLLGFNITLGVVYAIDREVARQQWNDKGYAKECIFTMNCRHFNNL